MRRFFLVVGLVLLLVGLFGGLNQVHRANAWHPIVSISGYTCTADYQWKVTGSVGNSESGWKMKIVSTTPDIGLTGVMVAKSGSVNFTYYASGNLHSLTISVTASWPGSSEGNVTQSVTVNFAGNCVRPTNTPVPPTATSTPRHEHLKIELCHATHSESHPYNDIWVDINSVKEAQDVGGGEGHHNHDDDAWKAYTYEGVGYPGHGDQSLLPGCVKPNTPTPTNTTVPPTATNTSVPPTATNVPPTVVPPTEVPPTTDPSTPTNTSVPPTRVPPTAVVPSSTPLPPPAQWGVNCNTNRIPKEYIGSPFWAEDPSGNPLGPKPLGKVEDAGNGYGKLSINSAYIHDFDDLTIRIIVNGQWLFTWTVENGQCVWNAPTNKKVTPQPGVQTGGDPTATDNSGLLFAVTAFVGLSIVLLAFRSR